MNPEKRHLYPPTGENLTVKEIARRENKSVAAIKARLRQGRPLGKSALKSQGSPLTAEQVDRLNKLAERWEVEPMRLLANWQAGLRGPALIAASKAPIEQEKEKPDVRPSERVTLADGTEMTLKELESACFMRGSIYLVKQALLDGWTPEKLIRLGGDAYRLERKNKQAWNKEILVYKFATPNDGWKDYELYYLRSGSRPDGFLMPENEKVEYDLESDDGRVIDEHEAKRQWGDALGDLGKDAENYPNCEVAQRAKTYVFVKEKRLVPKGK